MLSKSELKVKNRETGLFEDMCTSCRRWALNPRAATEEEIKSNMWKAEWESILDSLGVNPDE